MSRKPYEVDTLSLSVLALAGLTIAGVRATKAVIAKLKQIRQKKALRERVRSGQIGESYFVRQVSSEMIFDVQSYYLYYSEDYSKENSDYSKKICKRLKALESELRRVKTFDELRNAINKQKVFAMNEKIRLLNLIRTAQTEYHELKR